MRTPKINIPKGNPAPLALMAANPRLSAADMRDLLMEYGTDGVEATHLTHGRREAEWRASGQR